MANRLREATAPAYLLLCLVLGGSAQGAWQNMVLQLAGLAILVAAAASKPSQPVERQAVHAFLLALAALAVVALQCVPLPPNIWTHLGGRAPVVNGYEILGMAAPWQPLSLVPYATLQSLLGLIPPLALFASIVVWKAYRPSWLAAAIITGSIAGVLLGALQISSSGNIADSHWYLYPQSSFGFATGFFANANHMANLLACAIPFLAALALSTRSRTAEGNSALMVLIGAAVLLIFVGIAINHSLAVYALTPPVLAASALILIPRRSRWRKWWGVATVLLVVVAVTALATASVRTGQLGTDAKGSFESRKEMLSTTARAAGDFMPWGSGLGSFASVYHLYEDPLQVTDTYVVHAHDDYAELLLEMGVPGLLLLIAFFAWWGRAVFLVWRDPDAGPFARAASIASAAILIHSVVDFPLRTAAVESLFAASLALLIERRPLAVSSNSDLRPTRHVVIR